MGSFRRSVPPLDTRSRWARGWAWLAPLCFVLLGGCEPPTSQGTYSGGAPHGDWVFYYSNGQRQKAGPFDKGRESGRWTFWYESGQRKQEGDYKAGREEGPWIVWFENGQKAKQGAFRDGVEQGPWTFWHENGQRAREGTFLDGQEFGVWMQWDDQGRPRQILYFNKLTPELAELVEQIKGPDEALRDEAKAKLTSWGPDGLPALGALLKSDSPALKVYAAETIGRMGAAGRAGADSLVALLSDSSEAVQQAGFAALVKLGPGAVVGLQRALGAGEPRVRKEAARALGQIGKDSEPAMGSLSGAMNDAVLEVAQEAADALGRIGRPSLLLLADKFRSTNPMVRGLASRGLAAQAAALPEALKLLLGALTETDPVAADALAESLGRCSDVSLTPLLAALNDPNETIRRNASRSFGKIGKPAVQPLCDILISSTVERRRIWAAISLGEVGPIATSAIPVLKRAENDQPVRFYASEALRKIQK